MISPSLGIFLTLAASCFAFPNNQNWEPALREPYYGQLQPEQIGQNGEPTKQCLCHTGGKVHIGSRLDPLHTEDVLQSRAQRMIHIPASLPKECVTAEDCSMGFTNYLGLLMKLMETGRRK